MEQHFDCASDPEFPSAGRSTWCNGAGSSDKASCVSLSLLLLRKIDLDMGVSGCDLPPSQGAIPFVMMEVAERNEEVDDGRAVFRDCEAGAKDRCV